MNDIFWNAYPWLLWIHDYAKSMRFNPYGLLTALLTRYSALLPPNVVLQVTENDLPMSLNLDAVLVGTAGTGKGRQLAAARHLIPSNDSPVPFKEIKPKSGEGVVSKFAEMRPATDENGKPLKGQYSLQVLADRLEIVLGEVTYLAAAVGMDGSTLLSLLLEAFSNETIGGNTRGRQTDLVLPPYAYRLSCLVCAQPACSGVFFDNTESGFASRFVFARAGDPEAPDVRPPKPAGMLGVDADLIPHGLSSMQLKTLIDKGSIEKLPKAGELGYPLTSIAFPKSAADYADRLQLEGSRGLIGDLDAHKVEPTAKVAALIALLNLNISGHALADGFTVSDTDWQLALSYMTASAEARTYCMESAKYSRRSAKAQRKADDMIAAEEAERIRHAELLRRAERYILRRMGEKDPSHAGIRHAVLQQATSRTYRDVFGEAIAALIEEGHVIEREGGNGAKIYIATGG